MLVTNPKEVCLDKDFLRIPKPISNYYKKLLKSVGVGAEQIVECIRKHFLEVLKYSLLLQSIVVPLSTFLAGGVLKPDITGGMYT